MDEQDLEVQIVASQLHCRLNGGKYLIQLPAVPTPSIFLLLLRLRRQNRVSLFEQNILLLVTVTGSKSFQMISLRSFRGATVWLQPDV